MGVFLGFLQASEIDLNQRLGALFFAFEMFLTISIFTLVYHFFLGDIGI